MFDLLQNGSILVDGVDVKKLNLHWLREKIGVVAQEPVLFDTSIMENIRWGRDGVSDNEVIEAAKKANAFDFIEKLPQVFQISSINILNFMMIILHLYFVEIRNLGR